MYLGLTLNRLKDFDSACQAFAKALELEQNDCTIYLNYAVVLFNNGHKEQAKAQFFASEKIFQTLEEDDKEAEMVDVRDLLAEALGVQLSDSEY